MYGLGLPLPCVPPALRASCPACLLPCVPPALRASCPDEVGTTFCHENRVEFRLYYRLFVR
jgi:hypothetical protein